MAESTPAVEEHVQAEGFSVARLDGAPGSAQDAAGLAQLAQARGAHWVVVDGYRFGSEYQRKLKQAGLKILFVDDHGHAEHYSADLVLNQNPHATDGMYSSREAYAGLLLGPKFAMLRREFSKWREWKREIPAVARKVLVTMGGSDPDNITLRVMKALATVKIDGLQTVVVSGGSNPHIGSLQKAATEFVGKIDLVINISDMPERMAWADVGIIAAGGTLWELLCMGCPVLSYARNPVQGRIIAQLEGEGVVRDLGNSRDYDEASLVSAITELATSPARRSRMSSLGKELADGMGSRRLCDLLAGENMLPVDGQGNMKQYPAEEL
jgi:UDP-2,4-diacetamido-2,4,6-trideoxy-beta-L-altropyranose hydrolase